MEEWKEYKLGEVLTIKYGKDHKQIADGHIPIYGSGGIMRYGEQSLYEGPSILIPRKGSLNNIMYSDKPFWTVDTMFWTIINEDMANPLFVYYSICKKDFASLNVGSAVPSLTVPVIEDIDIQLPSKETQNRIVTILKSLDDKIEVNRRINDNFYFAFFGVMLIWLLTSLRNDNLEQQAQALFKSWLSLCKYEVTIGDLSMNITDYTKCDQKEVVLINSSDVTEGYFTHHNLSKNENLKGHFKKRFTKGDILYSQVRPRNRHWGYCTFDAENYLASTQLMVIRNKKDIVPSILLYQYLIDENVWVDFTLKTETRSGTFPQGNYEDLSSIKVPFGADVNDISIKLKSLYALLFYNEDESRRLAQLRDTLLPRLMSGELKVEDVTL